MSFLWTCAVCFRPKDERPAYERQLLFPGCGSVCGLQVRICVACSPSVRTLTADQLVELHARAHHEHHRRAAPVKPDQPHIAKKDPTS